MSPDGSVASAATWHLPDSSPSTAGAGASADEQLQEKLLPLAVGLYRAGALGPTLQQYKTNAGEEVKGAVREVVQQVLPVLLSACGDGLPQQPGPAGEGQIWEQLQVRRTRGPRTELLGKSQRVTSRAHDGSTVLPQRVHACRSSEPIPQLLASTLHTNKCACLPCRSMVCACMRAAVAPRCLHGAAVCCCAGHHFLHAPHRAGGQGAGGDPGGREHTTQVRAPGLGSCVAAGGRGRGCRMRALLGDDGALSGTLLAGARRCCLFDVPAGLWLLFTA